MITIFYLLNIHSKFINIEFDIVLMRKNSRPLVPMYIVHHT